ncbi:uncharacterized protein EI90DRAFT_3018114 [Cantharellus anzutake]|uniref:uncharacterized protein n=1 Tax=Cantharellus anzutake TaxID=1750568 RepID=UPI00190569AB|nr:uncharacterized protein EI90DRAFT_3018114 [Cantharellus anzutake]KAF8327626.1 hypothetical protein EI90DRAFT_3018114 [Cantharellus anzutake]
MVKNHIARIAHQKATTKATALPLPKDRPKNFQELTKEQKVEALTQLTTWRQNAWFLLPKPLRQNLTPGQILSNGEIKKLTEHLHSFTVEPKLLNYLAGLSTISRMTPAQRNSLWDLIQRLNNQYAAQNQKRVLTNKVKKVVGSNEVAEGNGDRSEGMDGCENGVMDGGRTKAIGGGSNDLMGGRIQCVHMSQNTVVGDVVTGPRVIKLTERAWYNLEANKR